MHPCDSKQHSYEGAPVLRPPLGLQISRWFVFTATVAIAIGMLAMLDQHLTGLPWVYDGPKVEFQGRTVTIDYCMLSPSAVAVAPSNCRFAFAAASVSLALSLIWTYIQGLRRNPYKHKNARIAELVLSLLATCWWVASGIILCIWTHRANIAGLPRTDWRNGLCALAWAQALFFAYLMTTSAMLVTSKSQKFFDKWEAKRKLKQAQKQQAKLQQLQQQEAAAANTARSAAATAAAEAGNEALVAPGSGPVLVPSAAAQAPQSAAAMSPGSAAGSSAWPASPGPGSASAEAIPVAADNPFLSQGPQQPLQPSEHNV